MKKTVVDESRWPIVLIRYGEDLDEAAMQAHFDEIRALLARNRRYVSVFDFSRSLPVRDPHARRIAGEFMKDTAELTEKLCAASAFVVPNTLMRGTLTAIFWFHKPSYPNAFFKDLPSALEWARPFAAQLRVGESTPSSVK